MKNGKKVPSKNGKAHYSVIFKPEPEGGFTVFVPALPGCITFGATLEEAQEMASDAIEGYVASLKKHGEPIPDDDHSLMGSVEIPNKTVSLRA